MILLPAKPIILFLKKHSLEFYRKNTKDVLEFPPEIVKYSQILDFEKFEELLTNFVSTKKFAKEKAIMVVSKDLIFEKDIPVDDKLDETKQNFLDSLPIGDDKIDYVSQKNTQTLNLYAVDNTIYKKIRSILEKAGWQIKLVVPVNIFSLSTEELDGPAQLAVFKNKKLLEELNLLEYKISEDQESAVGNEPRKLSIKKILFVIPVLLLVLGFGGLMVYRDFFVTTQQVQSIPIIEASPLPEVSQEPSSPSAQPIAYKTDKSEIKVRVLNGSGIQGEAGRVSRLLRQLEFEQINTGNAPEVVEDSTIIFSSLIHPDMREEIITQLSEQFPDLVIGADEDNEEYDILIITGR